MKKDIPFPKVEGVHMAVAQETNGSDEHEWRVYVLNERPVKLHGVLVTAKGYGRKDDRDVKTTTLRYFLDEIEPGSTCMVEPIQQELFGLTNEYWLSFYIDKQIYDKKYIFLPESIVDKNFIELPLLGKMGVMIE